MARRREAYRPGTLKNYRAAQRLFIQFCLIYKIDVSFPTEVDLAAYTEWLVLAALSSATIRNHLSALKMLYEWWGKGQVVASLSSNAWSLTVKGIVNTIRPSFDKRTAMTLNDLLFIMEAASESMALTPILGALTFGYMGFLRISNLAPPTLDSFDKTRHTTFGDVLLQKDGLIINLKWSKSRQNSRNAISIPLPTLGDTWICPLRAWIIYTRLLKDVKITKDTPLLLSTVEPVGKPLTIPMVRRMFNQAVDDAHLEHVGYTPHSLHQGGATLAYHAGVPIHAIKQHGTWRSEAINEYLFSQPLFDTPVAKTFGKLLIDYQMPQYED